MVLVSDRHMFGDWVNHPDPNPPARAVDGLLPDMAPGNVLEQTVLDRHIYEAVDTHCPPNLQTRHLLRTGACDEQ